MKKLNSAWIAVLGSIGVAAISGAVSYFVATDRLTSEDSYKRAELFKDLVGEFKSSEGDQYHLLSLWKIYPKDRRLIVITALQNPTPESIKLLSQLGYKEELAQYQDDIRRIYEAARGDSRRTIGQLFQSLDAIEQIDIVIEQVRNLDKITPASPVFQELEELIEKDDDALRHVAEIYRSTSKSELGFRIALAFALQGAGEKAQFDNLLTEFDRDISKFPKLASFLRERTAFDLGAQERSAVISLAAQHSKHVIDTNGEAVAQSYALDTLKNFYPSVVENSIDSGNFLETAQAVARNEKSRLTHRERALRLLANNGFEDLAAKVYLRIVRCDSIDETREELFERLAFGGVVLGEEIASATYDLAKITIDQQMTMRRIDCGQ